MVVKVNKSVCAENYDSHLEGGQTLPFIPTEQIIPLMIIMHTIYLHVCDILFLDYCCLYFFNYFLLLKMCWRYSIHILCFLQVLRATSL